MTLERSSCERTECTADPDDARSMCLQGQRIRYHPSLPKRGVQPRSHLDVICRTTIAPGRVRTSGYGCHTVPRNNRNPRVASRHPNSVGKFHRHRVLVMACSTARLEIRPTVRECVPRSCDTSFPASLPSATQSTLPWLKTEPIPIQPSCRVNETKIDAISSAAHLG